MIEVAATDQRMKHIGVISVGHPGKKPMRIGGQP
mgnify:CR=1 FL=1